MSAQPFIARPADARYHRRVTGLSASAQPPVWGAFLLRGWRAGWVSLLHRLPPGKRWRRIALWLRSPLKRWLPPVVDARVWNLKLRLHTRGNLSEQRLLLMPQYLDPLERDFLARELAAGGCFLDIGANIGAYSLWVAAQCPQTRIEAFEPDAELCERLRFNLATNRLDHVHLNRLALGDHEGEVRLVSGAGNKGENHMAGAGGGDWSAPMTTLPDFLARAGITRIDALKIDVERHEVRVLQPLFQSAPAATWPRLLVCELAPELQPELMNLLAANGYQLAARGRTNGIFRRAEP